MLTHCTVLYQYNKVYNTHYGSIDEFKKHVLLKVLAIS